MGTPSGSEGVLGVAFVMSFVSLMIGMALHQGRRRKEREHAERMRAMELGLVPQPSGLDWPAAAVCIAIGAGVPLGSFAVAWLATLTTNVANEIWFAPVFVSFAAIGASKKLTYRMIDAKGGSSVSARPTPVAKPEPSADAYDFAGHRA